MYSNTYAGSFDYKVFLLRLTSDSKYQPQERGICISLIAIGRPRNQRSHFYRVATENRDSTQKSWIQTPCLVFHYFKYQARLVSV